MKVSELKDKELLDYLEKKNKKCDYCPYDLVCPHDVVSTSGGDPLFPPCVDGLEKETATSILDSARDNEDFMNSEVE